MKVYVTARFKGADNKQEIEKLCKAVHDARLVDFCFVRDVENYQPIDDVKALWERTRDEIGACDMLLIDVSDNPTGGRVVEAGIAYAMRKPIIVIHKRGATYKQLYDGISSTVIEYENYEDLTKQLAKYDVDRNYNTTDRMTVLVMLLMVGGLVGWSLSQVFMPLGFVGALVYWLVVRHYFEQIRAYDRIVVYVPLIVAWWVGISLLNDINSLLALGWTIAFWLFAVFALRKFKLSL